MDQLPNIDQIPELLFRHLRNMDAETTNTSWYGGASYKTGLREFAAHLNPNLVPEKTPVFRFEEVWTRQLASRFIAQGIPAELLPRYPNGSEIGDLFLPRLSAETSLWIEMKGAWRYNLHPALRTNGVYKKHLLSSTEGAAKDMLKLAHAESSHAALLLVGFDAPEHGLEISDSDLAELKTTGRYDEHSWLVFTDTWLDGIVSGSRVRCWLWIRSLGSQAKAVTVPQEEWPAMSAIAAKSPSADSRELMIEKVRDRIRVNHSVNGKNWVWGDYYCEFSADCGIVVAKPEGDGPRQPRNQTRQRFAKAIRAVIPSDEYTQSLGLQYSGEIVEAILRFHGKL